LNLENVTVTGLQTYHLVSSYRVGQKNGATLFEGL